MFYLRNDYRAEPVVRHTTPGFDDPLSLKLEVVRSLSYVVGLRHQ